MKINYGSKYVDSNEIVGLIQNMADKIDELEEENASLKEKNDAQLDMIVELEQEVDDLKQSLESRENYIDYDIAEAM